MSMKLISDKIRIFEAFSILKKNNTVRNSFWGKWISTWWMSFVAICSTEEPKLSLSNIISARPQKKEHKIRILVNTPVRLKPTSYVVNEKRMLLFCIWYPFLLKPLKTWLRDIDDISILQLSCFWRPLPERPMEPKAEGCGFVSLVQSNVLDRLLWRS